MSDSLSETNFLDDILAAALREMDEGAKPSEVEARYTTRYPEHQRDIHDVVAMRALGSLTAGQTSATPTQLGDCRIRGIIAEGGMGTIYDAVQEPLGRRVAVKTIRGMIARRSHASEARFLREQAVLARLHHTNIVPIHAAGVIGDLRYFVMHYIAGASGSDLVRSVWEHASSHDDVDTPSLAEFAQSAERQLADPSAKTSSEVAVNRHVSAQDASDHQVNEAIPVRLSATYYRSVAKVMAEAADAIQHAHDVGICHRDIKPSNLMIDAGEHCWTLDFGLASYRASQNGHTAGASNAELAPEPTEAVTGVLGTYPYMSPEHYDGRADALSDVWGLGVTLYEFLCLRRAFPGGDQRSLERSIRLSVPVPIEQLAPGVPRDLAAIVRKATNKSPADRYPSAAAFRDDLRNWLSHKPVSARPAHALRKVWLWSRRHPGGAGAILTIAALLVVLAGTGLSLAEVATRNERAKAREIELLRLREERSSKKVEWNKSWRQSLTTLISANSHDRDFLKMLRTEAAEGSARFRVRLGKRFEGIGARFLAYDGAGRLLMGGVSEAKDLNKLVPSRIWEGNPTSEPRKFHSSSLGPVGFLPDGRPIQCTLRGENLVLLDLEADVPIRVMPLPGQIDPDHRGVAMVADGSRIAAIVTSKEAPQGVRHNPTLVVVFDGLTGQELRRFEGDYRSVAISPDGAFVAAGDGGGRVSLRSIADGQVAAVPPLGRSSITTLAFGRNPRRDHWPDRPRPAAYQWQLAVGDQGGHVFIWDLGTEQPTLRSSGSIGDGAVSALTFSPDGSTLAVGCHGPHGLWDTATGTLISELWGGNEDSPHAFSSDGSRVATASFDKFGRHSDVWVNEFADKRVARTLYGVRPPFREVVFSPDESLLAALSNDWQIGIWERATGRLLAVLDAPPGIDTGNAGFAISPDNRKVAFSSHESSRMWEIETGTILRDWKLPIGLSDKLRFDGPEHLILARAEAEGGAQPYDPAISDPKEHPRYCALYDLLAQDGKAPSPLRKITDLDIATHRVWISPDGRYVLLDGLGSDVDAAGNQLEVHSTRLYSLERPDPPVVYAVRLDVKANVGHLFDPTGSTLALHYANTEHLPTDSLFDFVSLPGGVRRTAPISLHRLGTLARIWTASVEDGARLGFFTAGRDKPFLEVNGDSALVPHRFSRDGRYTVGITNGPPVVVDLHGLSEELQKLGVGW